MTATFTSSLISSIIRHSTIWMHNNVVASAYISPPCSSLFTHLNTSPSLLLFEGCSIITAHRITDIFNHIRDAAYPNRADSFSPQLSFHSFENVGPMIVPPSTAVELHAHRRRWTTTRFLCDLALATISVTTAAAITVPVWQCRALIATGLTDNLARSMDVLEHSIWSSLPAFTAMTLYVAYDVGIAWLNHSLRELFGCSVCPNSKVCINSMWCKMSSSATSP